MERERSASELLDGVRHISPPYRRDRGYSRWLVNVHEGNPGDTKHNNHITIGDTPVRYVA